MGIFEEVKNYVTARSVVEHYGLKVNGSGVACCPFHDDHHPSMKIDQTYICFACGAKGDAVNYVSQMFHLTPYQAACKIVEDFHLPIKIGNMNKKELKLAKQSFIKKKHEKELKKDHEKRFHQWRINTIDLLKESLEDIHDIERNVVSYLGDDFMNSDEFAGLMHAKPIFEYWLDILCISSREDLLLLFINDRKEVDAYAGKTNHIIGNIRAKGKQNNGSGKSQQSKPA